MLLQLLAGLQSLTYTTFPPRVLTHRANLLAKSLGPSAFKLVPIMRRTSGLTMQSRVIRRASWAPWGCSSSSMTTLGRSSPMGSGRLPALCRASEQSVHCRQGRSRPASMSSRPISQSYDLLQRRHFNPARLRCRGTQRKYAPTPVCRPALSSSMSTFWVYQRRNFGPRETSHRCVAVGWQPVAWSRNSRAF